MFSSECPVGPDFLIFPWPLFLSPLFSFSDITIHLVTQATNLKFFFLPSFFYLCNVSWNHSYLPISFVSSASPPSIISSDKESSLWLPYLPNSIPVKSCKSISWIVFIFTLVVTFTILYYNSLFCVDILLDYILFKHRDYSLVHCVSLVLSLYDEKIICSILLKCVLLVLFLS